MGYMVQWDWDKSKWFKPTENWGEPFRIQKSLVRELERLRDFVKVPIFVTCGTQGAHVKDSEHYSGWAVDCYAVMPVMDFFLAATRFDFHSIGLYPQWKSPGLHLGMRPPEYDIRKLWLAINDGKEQKYLALDGPNLKKYVFGT